jgi:outer membrane receptor protein involved in Fe transport
LVSVGVVHSFTANTSLSGKAYFRDIKTSTLNGDINEASLDQAVYQPTPAEQATLAAAGYTGFPTSGESAANTPFPYWRCIANILNNEEPNEKCDGLMNRTASTQRAIGASAQLSMKNSIANRDNRLSIGSAIEDSRVEFSQSTQFGYLLFDRGVATVEGPGAFADGTQNSEDAFDARVDLVGHTRTWNLYASDTLSLNDHWQITVSGSYYLATLVTQDLLAPGGGAGSLDGDHRFSHFNPAVGITTTPLPGVNFYVGASRSSRVPSIIELGCADPEHPCKLPNALAGDPPLNQVIATTFEFGARSTADAKLKWHAGVFRSENRDDILFVADEQSGFGYFTNVGKTLRQGVELELSKEFSAISIGANYTFLQATYRSAETLGATGNSTNDMAESGARGFEGTIDIEPGDRIPLIPEHTFKGFIEFRFNERLSMSTDVLAVSSTFARGNENNLHQPDGIFYLGPGDTPAYVAFNFSCEYRPFAPLTIFAQVTNLLDRQYYTAAQLGATGLRADGTFIAQPFATPVINGARPVVQSTFYSPGGPRAFLMGIRYRFGTAPR